MSDVFYLASVISLASFAALGMYDGIYLHLWKYRLFARPEARGEHMVHTIRAVLFIPAMAWVFAGNTSGMILWFGLVAIVVDFAVQIIDTRVEADSRRFQGGLPGHELGVHVAAALSHFALIVTSLLARPKEAFAHFVPIHGEGAALASDAVWKVFMGGTVIVAVIHLALLHRWFARRVDETLQRFRTATIAQSL